MKLKKILLPDSSGLLKQGLRFAVINSLFILISGTIIRFIFIMIDRLNNIRLMIPLPVFMLTILFIIPYYIFSYSYGKHFGLKLNNRNFIKGLTVGLIGETPGFLLLYFVLQNYLDSALYDTIPKILFNMLIMTIIIIPLMIALGSMDKK